MTTTTIRGVYEIATSTLWIDPPLVPGDVTILVPGGSRVDLATPTTQREVGYPDLTVTLTSAEDVEGAIIRFEDQTVPIEWIGPVMIWPFVEGGGGGGDATEDKQAEIISYLTGGKVTVQSPVTSMSTIELIEGDAYDGLRSPKLAWAVERDYSGFDIELRIWRWGDGGETLMFSGPGAVASETLLEVSMVAEFIQLVYYGGCDPVEKLKFELTASSGGETTTITKGDAYVYRRS